MVQRRGISQGVRTNGTVRTDSYSSMSAPELILFIPHLSGRNSHISFSSNKHKLWEELDEVEKNSTSEVLDIKSDRLERNRQIKKKEFKSHLQERKCKMKKRQFTENLIQNKESNAETTKTVEEAHGWEEISTKSKYLNGFYTGRTPLRKAVQGNFEDVHGLILYPYTKKMYSTRNQIYHDRYGEHVIKKEKLEKKRDIMNQTRGLVKFESKYCNSNW
ncbi:nrdF [Acrasis kona]|uniref:NrdF n=1 Tax=Acrasis kona TaxID=1008807 RepID=A0AAW2Z548_9EUKA